MKNRNFTYYYSRFGVFAILIVAMIIASLLSPVFLSQRNLINVLRQNAVITIIAFGAQMVIINGDVDLSPGSVAAFAGCLGTMVMKSSASLFLAVITAAVIGIAIGFANGWVITKFNIPPFINSL